MSEIIESVDFLENPISYAHASWFDEVIALDDLDSIRSNHLASVHINNWLFDEYVDSEARSYSLNTLQSSPAMNFSIYLSEEQWQSLFDYLAVISIYKQVCAVIGKNKRQAIIDQIGEEFYNYAVKRAPLLLNDNNYQKLNNALVNISKRCEIDEPDEYDALMLHRKQLMMFLWLRYIPNALSQRIKLRLDKKNVYSLATLLQGQECIEELMAEAEELFQVLLKVMPRLEKIVRV